MFILDPFTPLNNAYSLELPVHILHRACPPPLLQSKTDIKLCFGFLIVSGPRALCLSLSTRTPQDGAAFHGNKVSCVSHSGRLLRGDNDTLSCSSESQRC